MREGRKDRDKLGWNRDKGKGKCMEGKEGVKREEREFGKEGKGKDTREIWKGTYGRERGGGRNDHPTSKHFPGLYFTLVIQLFLQLYVIAVVTMQ
jgi:hypothetical protein